MMVYYLKSPSGAKRKTFSIYGRVVNTNGTTTNITQKIPELDEINQQQLTGRLTLAEAKALAKLIVDQMNGKLREAARLKSHVTPANQKLLDAYWSDVYCDRDLEDEQSAWRKLERVVEILGPLSIQTASKPELANHFKRLDIPARSKRALISSLNQLLKYAKRGFWLALPKKQREQPRYLSWSEFEEVMRAAPEAVRVPCWIAFLTGLRVGEVYAITEHHFLGKAVRVEEQRTNKGKLKGPKWDSRRQAFAHGGTLEWLRKWDQMDRSKISRHMVNKHLTRACRRLFPQNPIKHCSFHDLRHSYAIHLIPRVGITMVAQSLGNSVRVCQEYYAGFQLADESVAMIAQLVERMA
jgi:integrase